MYIYGAAPTAIANTDYSNDVIIDINRTNSFHQNDTACNVGSRSYSLKNKSSNITIINFNESEYGFVIFTLDSGNYGYIEYNLSCAGTIVDSATIHVNTKI